MIKMTTQLLIITIIQIRYNLMRLCSFFLCLTPFLHNSCCHMHINLSITADENRVILWIFFFRINSCRCLFDGTHNSMANRFVSAYFTISISTGQRESIHSNYHREHSRCMAKRFIFKEYRKLHTITNQHKREEMRKTKTKTYNVRQLCEMKEKRHQC